MEKFNPAALSPRTADALSRSTAQFMSRVYGWMTLGIALTGFISFYIGNNPELLMSILKNPGIVWGVIIAQFATVLAFSFLLPRISAPVASALYLFYSALFGVTLSIIFYVYTRQSIAQVFGITGFAFAGLSGFGYVTKRDLGPVGSFCTMGLFGIIGWSILSIFFPSMMGGSMGPTFSIIGLIVFAGLTAYDTQKIKALNAAGGYAGDEKKGAIFGALTLYLDFVNMFMMLLRLMGDRK
ncbi:MAG: hypothetical protein JWQ35_1699 [Bacteriovoracaceae bacterium]|nr:hypothetical protein [Bacteriovoracaceae bacterium]